MTSTCGCGRSLCPWCHDRGETQWLACDRCGEYGMATVPSGETSSVMICDCTPTGFVSATVCDAPRCAYCRETAAVLHGRPLCTWHADSGAGRREAFEMDEAVQ